jgi:hypothetical protein
MTSVQRNVLNELVACILTCTENQAALTTQETDLLKLRERALDMFKDLEQKLCSLAASCITAPMSGRMFIALPLDYYSERERKQSLEEQMR